MGGNSLQFEVFSGVAAVATRPQVLSARPHRRRLTKSPWAVDTAAMGTVADKLRDALPAERLAEPRGVALLAWAESQGDDLGRAWATCRRVDHLMLLAGAAQVPLGALVRAAGRLVRPVAALAPRKDAPHVTRLVYAAEHWTGVGGKPVRDVGRQLRATAKRLDNEQTGQGDRYLARSIAALTPMMKGPAEKVLAALKETPAGERSGESDARRAGEVLEVEVAVALAVAEVNGALGVVADDLRQTQQVQAGVLALLAGSELGSAVDAATVVMDSMRRLTAMGDGDPEAVRPEAVRALAAEAGGIEASLYDSLARALSLVADATARDAAARWAMAGEPGFRDTLARTVLESCLHVATRPGEPVAVLPLHQEVERVIAAERLGRLRSMADALRAAVPAPQG